jgi:hypothetical protein
MSDPYQDCEMAVQKILLDIDDITDKLFKMDSVKLGDFRVLDGGYDRSCVITPGPFVSNKISEDVKSMVWLMNVEIYQRYKDAVQAFADFKHMRGKVINELNSRPTLKLSGLVQIPGVQSVLVQAGGEPAFVSKENTNITTHIVQTLNLQIIQIVQTIGGEFA